MLTAVNVKTLQQFHIPKLNMHSSFFEHVNLKISKLHLPCYLLFLIYFQLVAQINVVNIFTFADLEER